MYGQEILYGISKFAFEISHKISYPYIEKNMTGDTCTVQGWF